MDLSQINLVSLFASSFLVKAIEIALVALFIIYSLVIVREVSLMNRTVQTAIRGGVSMLAYIQLLVGVGVLLVILFS